VNESTVNLLKLENVYLTPDASFQINGFINVLQQRLEVMITVLKSIPKHKHTDHIWDSVVQQ